MASTALKYLSIIICACIWKTKSRIDINDEVGVKVKKQRIEIVEAKMKKNVAGFVE